jgi:hypothetical protein
MPRLAARFEHEPIAPAQPFDGHLQTTKPITLIRIRPGKIEHQIGLMLVQDVWNVDRQRVQILLVTGAVVEGDVTITDFLLEREILFAVE